MFYRSAAQESPEHHAQVAEALKKWLKDKEIVRRDLARLEECIADRGRNGHCPVPETA